MRAWLCLGQLLVHRARAANDAIAASPTMANTFDSLYVGPFFFLGAILHSTHHSHSVRFNATPVVLRMRRLNASKAAVREVLLQTRPHSTGKQRMRNVARGVTAIMRMRNAATVGACSFFCFCFFFFLTLLLSSVTFRDSR